MTTRQSKANEVQMRRWYAARNKQMFLMHENGSTYPQIAHIYKLSRERVRQCVFRHIEGMRIRRKGNTIVDGSMRYTDLGVRARNCLMNMGVKDLTELRGWTDRELLRCPNFGKSSLIDLKRACDMVGITIGWDRYDDKEEIKNTQPTYPSP